LGRREYVILEHTYWPAKLSEVWFNFPFKVLIKTHILKFKADSLHFFEVLISLKLAVYIKKSIKLTCWEEYAQTVQWLELFHTDHYQKHHWRTMKSKLSHWILAWSKLHSSMEIKLYLHNFETRYSSQLPWNWSGQTIAIESPMKAQPCVNRYIMLWT
jgi:hypothetical protein